MLYSTCIFIYSTWNLISKSPHELTIEKASVLSNTKSNHVAFKISTTINMINQSAKKMNLLQMSGLTPSTLLLKSYYYNFHFCLYLV